MYFGEVEQVFFSQAGSILNPPFPTPLASGTTLAAAGMHLGFDRVGVWLSALVNWGALFTPPAGAVSLLTSGFIDISFELLLENIVLQRITQTALQKGAAQSLTPSATVMAAGLLYFDQTALSGVANYNTYTLRVGAISLGVPVYDNGAGSVSAAAGAVSLAAVTVEACRK